MAHTNQLTLRGKLRTSKLIHSSGKFSVAHMKIFIAQQNYHIGNVAYNRSKIIEAIDLARKQGAELLVFSELAVCGYPPRDLLLSETFLNECASSVALIAAATSDISVLIGTPAVNSEPIGKPLFNAAVLIENGEVVQTIHKSCLPTYDVFDEDRYFEPASSWNCITVKGKRIGVTICEDLWNIGTKKRYAVDPVKKLMTQKPDLIINLSASPFDVHHQSERIRVLRHHAIETCLPIVYCNAVGAQTDLIFDGASMVMGANGNIQTQCPAFVEGVFELDWTGKSADKANESISFSQSFNSDLNIESIHDALVMGIRDYFSKMGFTRAILGSSGGIDSAVALALTAEALGAENVLAVLMPSVYSSAHSVDDAIALSKRLNNPFEIVPIHDSHAALEQTLQPFFEQRPAGLAEENLQSRIRGNLLMAIANKLDFILINTSNKSELATGYGTLYGDMTGGLSVLGDCYKTQVYALARYINQEAEIIPSSILEKAPSAELRPNQKDSDSLPDYALLDEILYLHIEQLLDQDTIIQRGFDASIVEKTLKLLHRNEYKRQQFCPILRISSKAFGSGRRIPIVSRSLF
jgi:NAD+ synthase (glutamine-hydrolysing)